MLLFDFKTNFLTFPIKQLVYCFEVKLSSLQIFTSFDFQEEEQILTMTK